MEEDITEIIHIITMEEEEIDLVDLEGELIVFLFIMCFDD